MDKEYLLVLITRYIDQQLDAEERSKVEQMMLDNPAVKNLVSRLRSATSNVHNALLLSSGAKQGFKHPEQCLTDQTLVNLCDKKLSAPEAAKIEKHILKCDTCLKKVVESLRTSSHMSKGKFPEIPENTRKKIDARGLVNFKEPEEDTEKSEKISVSLDEIKMERFSFTEKSLSVQISLCKNLSETGAQVAIVINDSLTGKSDRLITINNADTGRKHLSAKTDEDGSLIISKLVRGNYVIHFLGSELKVELEIS